MPTTSALPVFLLQPGKKLVGREGQRLLSRRSPDFDKLSIDRIEKICRPKTIGFGAHGLLIRMENDGRTEANRFGTTSLFAPTEQKAGRGDRIRTCDFLLPKQAL